MSLHSDDLTIRQEEEDDDLLGGLFIVLLSAGMLVGFAIAGVIAWGFPFIAGMVLMFVGMVLFGCWALGEATPW